MGEVVDVPVAHRREDLRHVVEPLDERQVLEVDHHRHLRRWRTLHVDVPVAHGREDLRHVVEALDERQVLEVDHLAAYGG